VKVRVTFTVDVDDRFRRALNHYYGREGLASRSDIQKWYESNASSVDADMFQEYDMSEVKGDNHEQS